MNRRPLNLIGVCIVAIFALLLTFFVSCEPELETRDCVVMLGDSIFDLSGEEPEILMELAGQEWRTYYQSGAQLQGGSIIAPGDIEDQLDDAIRDGNIRTIIMDGGGNDFLLGYGTDSMVESELKAGWGDILDKAQDAGVETIVFQGYYPCSGSDSGSLEVNDSIIAWLPAQGAAHGINIITYNPNQDSWFLNQSYLSYTIYDGIHPNTSASQHMAEKLWQLMVANDIEQSDNPCPDEPDDGCY